MVPEVSIIVPVYNVENLLVKCVESILHQTLKGIEIILVDDGSTDNSGKICDELAKRDETIHVIHKENGGLSDARNAGIDIAKGKYIGFVDSDDYIHQEMYSTLLSIMKEKECDIVESGYKEVYDGDQSCYDTYNSSHSIRIYEKQAAVLSTAIDHDCRNYVWNKLYKAELWSNIRFPKGKLFEDVFVTHKVVNLANKVAKIDYPFYYYYQRPNSIVNSKFTANKLDHCEALEQLMKFIEVEYPAFSPVVAIPYFNQCLQHLDKLTVYKKDIENSQVFIEDLTKKILDKKYLAYLKSKEVEKVCNEILGSNARFLLKQKQLIILRLFCLKKSVNMFYAFNQLLGPFKEIIKKLVPIK
ncbi:glycosyltransferase [Priestia flexa]|uniref:glycosyltransferase n=1 Tax=Priestia flexa TaxID=86664 RepID=UPI0011A28367|nr:glycosyltransferase [Priestia flexa]